MRDRWLWDFHWRGESRLLAVTNFWRNFKQQACFYVKSLHNIFISFHCTISKLALIIESICRCVNNFVYLWRQSHLTLLFDRHSLTNSAVAHNRSIIPRASPSCHAQDEKLCKRLMIRRRRIPWPLFQRFNCSKMLFKNQMVNGSGR